MNRVRWQLAAYLPRLEVRFAAAGVKSGRLPA